MEHLGISTIIGLSKMKSIKRFTQNVNRIEILYLTTSPSCFIHDVMVDKKFIMQTRFTV